MPAGVSAQLDPKAVQFTKPEDIKWVKNAAGTQETAVLFGDPTKEGPYVIRLRWLPGNMSQPHSHPTRPLLRGDLGHLVAGVRVQVRAREDRAA